MKHYINFDRKGCYHIHSVSLETLFSELDEQVVKLHKEGKHAAAIKLVENTLKIATETYGPDHVYVKTTRNNLALLYKAKNHSPVRQAKGTKACNISRNSSIRHSIVFFLFIIAVSMGVLAMPMPPQPEPVSASTSRPEQIEFPFYQVKANFYPESRNILGEMEVLFQLDEPKQEILFNLYLNRYNNDKHMASELRKYAAARGFDPGYIDIQSVLYNELPVPFWVEGERLRVGSNDAFYSRGEQSLKITFNIKIPFTADRVGGNKEGIWLGNWIPTICVDTVDNQSTDIGDPFMNLSSTYDLIFSVPRDYSLVLSNIITVQELGDLKIYHARLDRVRDLPVFLNHGYREATVKEGDTEIHYFYTSPNSRAQEVLDTAGKAVSFYEDFVGDYPWKQLNIVEVDMFLSGMEYSTLLLVSKKSIQNNLEGTVFHEVGHQWFYNIVGSDQYHSPYIDEGLVQFLTSYVLRDKAPVYWSNLEGLDKNLSQFGSWQQYRNIHYSNGEKFYENLYYILGKEDFEAFIKDYYNTYKYSFVTPDTFKQFLTEKLGEESNNLLINLNS